MLMSSIPYIDIHTHQLIADQEIISVLNIDTNDSQANLKADQAFSIGIHPWDIEKLQFDSAKKHLEECISNVNPSAIGEIGLDKAITTPMDIQEKVFLDQLQAAMILQKPVIIHCVKAHEEILRIKKNHDTGTSWIFHGFNKNLQLAETFLKHGFYLTFGEALLRNEKLQRVFEQLPLDKIFLETDDKEISVKEIYTKAATIKKIEIEALKKQMLLNYIKCF
ncbi:TatD family hydrolase [Marinifilum caeruleilacunae]|uniref:TatD family deoxyribonuclease n=1 Tax=Marinifilum caeruleilacunae TaxID=2499076 RepID=A0ABX1WTD9_9BACT|nr:TatD family hydrolase [Marinifilum caeruleilacunae]NOU59183.1 TatD family deoxyribonuclease [Marinifilum caeruleilacunae]